jgi:alpha-tubulin suppressor-like RCC1 family protein
MKTIRRILLIGAGLLVSLNLLHAQETATAVQDGTVLSVDAARPVESLSAYDAALQLLESVPPTPAESLPNGGTFWSAQHAPGSGDEWPPLPGNILGLSAWSLGDGVFLLDDTNVNYVALQDEAELMTVAQPARLKTSSSRSGGMSPMFSLISSSGGVPVYLTNLVVTPDNSGNMTATFDIAGGTNGFAYDIYSTTNLLDSPIYTAWNWLGQGYTSNSYTFSNQSPGDAFYILAIPLHTMVLAWGDDASGQCDVPSGLTNAIDVAAGFNFSVALKADSTVSVWGDNTYGETNAPAGLTNVTAIAAGFAHALALLQNGTVVAWGADSYGQTNVPSGLTNVTAIAAGFAFSMALRNDGTIVAWGDNRYHQTNVPAFGPASQIAAGWYHGVALLTNGTVASWGITIANDGITNVPSGLSNVVSIAAGAYHSLAVKTDGTVAAWGAGSTGSVFENYDQCIVPSGLSNVVAVAGGASHSMALESNGVVVAWGDDSYGETEMPDRLTGVKAISAGGFYSMIVRSGQLTPVIWEEPEDQYAIAGATVTFSSEGEGLAGVNYQWQFDGVNITGATNSSLILTNVQIANAGSYQVLISDSAGSVTSDAANLYIITPPVITYRSTPTNQVCIYGNYLSFVANVTATGQAYGFPLTYQWQFNGTNISGATTNFYNFTANDNASGIYSLTVSNAAGGTNVSWFVTMTNTINVTNDLLLIYNTNSTDSTTVENYYLTHRPMVSGANVLGIGCSNGEIINGTDFTNQILTPYVNWLAANPAKHPQYLILFLGIPSRVEESTYVYFPSVQYQLVTDVPGIQPYVTSINMNGTNDCIAYINKLTSFGTNDSPGQLVISASAGGYGNTNYALDNVRYGFGYPIDYSGNSFTISNAANGLSASGVLPSAIIYDDGVETITNGTNYNLPHITNATSVAGYICWGEHSSLGEKYATNGSVNWTGHSSWWIIETIESFNGEVAQRSPMGNFTQWYSNNAFGGTNYSNTPVGAVTHVEEPGGNVNDAYVYFGLWASGKNFAVCAWNSRVTDYFQAVGDPLIIH